jgi:hypothetical protein
VKDWQNLRKVSITTELTTKNRRTCQKASEAPAIPSYFVEFVQGWDLHMWPATPLEAESTHLIRRSNFGIQSFSCATNPFGMDVKLESLILHKQGPRKEIMDSCVHGLYSTCLYYAILLARVLQRSQGYKMSCCQPATHPTDTAIGTRVSTESRLNGRITFCIKHMFWKSYKNWVARQAKKPRCSCSFLSPDSALFLIFLCFWC